MHDLKVFANNKFVIQPYNVQLEKKVDQFIGDLVELFSKPEIIHYNRNRELTNKQEASRFLNSTIRGYENQTHFDYFILNRYNASLIGTVHLVSPKMTKSLYPFLSLMSDIKDLISGTWTIEYYLDVPYRRKGLMTRYVKLMIGELFNQGASAVCALVSEDNMPSILLLKKLEFTKDSLYKDHSGQALYWRKRPVQATLYDEAARLFKIK